VVSHLSHTPACLQDAEAQLEEIGENALHNCIMIANNANARVSSQGVHVQLFKLLPALPSLVTAWITCSVQ
jgi:hypothetical protein